VTPRCGGLEAAASEPRQVLNVPCGVYVEIVFVLVQPWMTCQT